MNINTNLIDLSLMRKNIETQSKYVSNGGYETNTDMLIDKLSKDTEITILDQSLNGLEKSKYINNQYNNIFKSLTDITETFKTTLIKRNNDSTNNFDKLNIDNELFKLKETFDKVKNTKFDNETAFIKNSSFIFVGNNERTTRRMNDSFLNDIETKFNDISSTSDGNLKIEKIDEILNILSSKFSEVGTEGNKINNLIGFKENLKISTIESFELKHQKLEENIIKLNSYMDNYKATLLMIKKMEDLTLTKYL